MMRLWLQFTLVGALALAGWICGIDANAAPMEAVALWAASALFAAHAVRGLFLRPQ
jgi:hypothetical protein